MPRNTIVVVWVGGLLVAVIVYLTGPDQFLYNLVDLVERGWWGLEEALRNISIAAFDLVRALAIGLYFVFVVLTLLVMRHGGRARAALIALSAVFFALIWHSAGYGFGAHTRWLAALALVALGALSMTRRLVRPQPSPWRQDAAPANPARDPR